MHQTALAFSHHHVRPGSPTNSSIRFHPRHVHSLFVVLWVCHLESMVYWLPEEAEAGPLAPFGAPTRKPLENLRETCLRDRMRPEPVVFLRLAFSPQLSISSVSSVEEG